MTDVSRRRLPIWIPVGLAILVAGYAVVAYELNKAVESSQTETCRCSIVYLGLSLLSHVDDAGGLFPSSKNWYTVLSKSELGKWRDWCPVGTASDFSKPSYAMNARLSGFNIKDVRNPAKTVMLFESIRGWNLAGGHELFPEPARHQRGFAVVFVSGEASVIQPGAVDKLIWNPLQK